MIGYSPSPATLWGRFYGRSLLLISVQISLRFIEFHNFLPVMVADTVGLLVWATIGLLLWVIHTVFFVYKLLFNIKRHHVDTGVGEIEFQRQVFLRDAEARFKVLQLSISPLDASFFTQTRTLLSLSLFIIRSYSCIVLWEQCGVIAWSVIMACRSSSLCVGTFSFALLIPSLSPWVLEFTLGRFTCIKSQIRRILDVVDQHYN